MSILTLTIGMPGAGKSFWAKDYCNASGSIYLSSDRFRELLGEGEHDQTVNQKVFSQLFLLCNYFLTEGFDVVVDACNINKASRKNFVKVARQGGAKTMAIVFDTNFETCVKRNAGRDRKVPVHVIEKMRDSFHPPTRDEFDFIHHINVETAKI